MIKKMCLLSFLLVLNLFALSDVTKVGAVTDPGGGSGIVCDTNYLLGYDSVDSNNNIQYGESTTYDTELTYAINLWNSKGSVDIEPDTFWTTKDLQFSNEYHSDVSWVGQYSHILVLTDTIVFNTYYMSGYSTTLRENVALHEIGHALGLDHSYSGNLLYMYVSSQITFGAMDSVCYTALWG